MNINYAHFGVLSKDVKVLKKEKEANLASFFEPIGDDKQCFFALPAFHLFTDIDFLAKNTSFCFELLDSTLLELKNPQRQEALLFCLEVAGSFSVKIGNKYEKFNPQLLELTNKYLDFSFYQVNKGLGLRSGHRRPDLNSVLTQICSLFVYPVKSNNVSLEPKEAGKLLNKIITLRNKDMVFIPDKKEEFLIGSSCFSCFKNFIECVVGLNENCDKPISANIIKDIIISCIMESAIPKGENKNDWLDIKEYLDVKSKLQTSFFIQKILFFDDYIWGVLDSSQSLFKINPKKLLKIANNHSLYNLQRDKEICAVENKKMSELKVNYESLEGYMSYFNYNQSVKNTNQWSPGHSLTAYINRALKVFNKIKKSKLLSSSQLQSLIDRSFVDVIVSLGREKKHKEALGVALLCKDPLQFLLDDNCKLTEFTHSGDDDFFNLFLKFLIEQKLVNPFNCNAINLVEVLDLEKTHAALKYVHHEAFTLLDKTIIEQQLGMSESAYSQNYVANKI